MVGFDERRLLGAAAAQLKVDEPLELEFLLPFRKLVDGLREEAGLSQVGAWRVGARLMDSLEQRVALREFEARTPELRQQQVRAPIFVTGMPRAATHLLHNLLARTPGLWAPRLWELQQPIPPARIDERWIDRQIRATKDGLQQLFEGAPALRRLHPLTPMSPADCSGLLRHSFSTLDHALRWHVPSYVDYMLNADLSRAYADHRRFVRLLAYRHRYDERGQARMVLEDPWHLCHLDSLLEAYPDAWIVRVTSERAEAVEATTRMAHALQSFDAKRPPRPAKLRPYCERLVDAGLAAGERGSARLPSWRLVEVSSASLLEDPVAVVKKLGAYLRIPSSDHAVDEAARWLGDTLGKDPLASASSANMRISAIL